MNKRILVSIAALVCIGIIISLMHLGYTRSYENTLNGEGSLDNKLLAISQLGRLGRIADRDWTVSVLSRFLSDPNPNILVSASLALGGLGDPSAVDNLGKILGNKQGLAQNFSLTISAKVIASEHLQTLARLDKTGIQGFITGLDNDDTDVKQNAVQNLQRIGDFSATPFLIDYKDDPAINYQVRVSLETLGAYRPIAITQPESIIRAIAAQQLGEIGDPSAIAPLVAGLQDVNVSVRKESANALGNLGQGTAIEPLKRLLVDWYSNYQAIMALEKLGWQPNSEEEKIRALLAKRSWEELHSNWKSFKAIVLDDLRSDDPRLTENALFGLIGVGHQETIGLLTELFDSEIDIALLNALSETGYPEFHQLALRVANDSKIQLVEPNLLAPVEWGLGRGV